MSTYVKQVWENLPSEQTPLSAPRLLHMETQAEKAVADSKAYVDSEIAKTSSVPDVVQSIRTPYFIAHRGNRFCYPEHSLEAYRATFEGGYSPEADVRILKDGTLVCVHDATTARTMTGSDAVVKDMTVSEWRAKKVLPAVRGILKGSAYGTPVLFEDYLDMFGGKVPLFPEVKDPDAVPAVIEAIKRRNLQKSVVMSSFNWPDVIAMQQAGIYAAKAGTPDKTPQEYVDLGMFGAVFNSTTVSNATISSFKAAGLKVFTYTLNTPSSAASDIARGVDFIYTDDTWEMDPTSTPAVSLETHKGFIPPASVAAVQDDTQGKPVVRLEGFELHGFGSAPTRSVIKLGHLGTGSNLATIRFTVRGIENPAPGSATASWLAGVYLGIEGVGDVPVQENSDSAYRLALIRSGGGVAAFRKDTFGGTSTSATGTLAGVTTAANGTSKEYEFEIEFRASDVVIRECLSNTSAVLAVPSISRNDCYITIANNRMSSRISDIRFYRP